MMLKSVPQQQHGDAGFNQVLESQKRFRLAKLLRSTEEILNHAQQKDWELVEELESQRQLELAACFSETDHVGSPEVIEALGTLVYMNKQITQLVVQAKHELMDQQQTDLLQQQAASNYDWKV